MPKNMYLIFEGTSFGEYELLEQSVPLDNKPKVRIKTILQTTDEVNKNKRLYKSYLISKGIQEIIPFVKERRQVGELDHPVPTGNTVTDAYRQTVVLYKLTSHIITDISLQGNVVYGDVETALTEHGFNMAGLILDGVKVGFSLRAVGRLQSNGNFMEVKEPFHIITYDCVSNPSHAEAKMVEIVNQSGKPSESTTVMEGVALDRSNLLYGTTSQIEYLAEQVLEKLHTGATDIELENAIDQIIEAYLTETDEIDRDIHSLIEEYATERTEKIRQLIEYYLS